MLLRKSNVIHWSYLTSRNRSAALTALSQLHTVKPTCLVDSLESKNLNPWLWGCQPDCWSVDLPLCSILKNISTAIEQIAMKFSTGTEFRINYNTESLKNIPWITIIAPRWQPKNIVKYICRICYRHFKLAYIWKQTFVDNLFPSTEKYVLNSVGEKIWH